MKNGLLPVLLLVSFILISGCSDKEIQISAKEAIDEKETFERNYPDIIKGLVEPSGDHFREILRNELHSIKTLGVNTLAVYVDYSYGDGRFMLETAFGGPGFAGNAVEESISLIKEAKKNGFAVHLALSFGGGQNRRFDVPLEKFLSDTKTEAVKWAKIADEYQVEYFAPASEIDYQIFREYFDEDWSSSQKQDEAVEIANKFHEDILPEIKETYGGKVVYQRGMFNPNHLSKGYDYLGTGLNQVGRELEDFRGLVSEVYSSAEEIARKSGSGWLVTELWIPYRKMVPESPEAGDVLRSPKGLSYEDLQGEFYKIAFEEYQNFQGKIKPSGLIFTQYLMPWGKVKYTPAEELIRLFFQDIKPVEQSQAVQQNQKNLPFEVASDDTINLNDKTSLPVLHNIGINIENYNPATKMAGDFEFMDTSDHYQHKIFLEFGIELESPGGSSVLPSYNYVLPLGTKVFSPVAGTIETVRYQDRDNDYEVNIVPDGFPKWRVSLDHVINLKVQEGDKVQPGDIVGERTPWTGLGSKRGFVELQVWKAARQAPLGVCPFLLLDETIKDNIKGKINQLAKDWEKFLGRNVYDEDKWIAPGCLSETEIT